MEPYAAERQVKLATEIACDIGEVEVDGRAIQQAVVNLIDNAIKHSPQHGVVEIGIGQVGRGVPAEPPPIPRERLGRDASPYLSISVCDQGEGIPMREREKIFERFYRCGSELRRETQGVGIGLSIVKHIVDAHAGTITVDSESGKGSTFTIALPRQRKEEANES